YIKELRHNNDEQQGRWQYMKAAKQKQLTSIFTSCIIAAVVLAIVAPIIQIPLLFAGSGFLLLAGILQYFFGKQTLKTTEQIFNHEAQEDNIPWITAEEKERAENLLAQDR